MSTQQKFSINGAEIGCIESDGKNIEEWQHSFLCLVSETQKNFDPDAVRVENIVRQLHFSPIRGSYKPEIRKEDIDLSIRGRFGRTKLFPILGGQAAGILPVWDHMVAYSEDLIENGDCEFGADPRYDDFAINCRTLVRAALNSIDLELYAEFTRSSAGMKAPALFKGNPYDHGFRFPEKRR
jgi:hypothetical protein